MGSAATYQMLEYVQNIREKAHVVGLNALPTSATQIRSAYLQHHQFTCPNGFAASNNLELVAKNLLHRWHDYCILN